MPRPLSRLAPRSLRWRLTVWVAGVMLLSAGVIFAVVYNDTGRRLRSQIDRDITGDTAQLSDLVSSRRGRNSRQVMQAIDLYLGAQPYSATSTLLFALVPGQGTATNHPELFGFSGRDDGEPAAEQQREIRLGRNLLIPRIGYSTERVPDAGKMRIHERSVRLGASSVTVGAGQPLAAVEQAQHGVAQAFIIAGALTLVIALIASYLAGVRVSSPLRRMTTVATRVDAGDLEPRMAPPEGGGDEVRVLAESFNRMLDRLAEAFASQREFIADASHELRTPITVIRGQLEVLAASDNPSAEDVRRAERAVQAEITRISRLVDDLLLLAQAERADFLRVEPIDLPSFVTELWDGVSLTAARRFELSDVPPATLRADPDRLAQALRNLAGNAVAHTSEHDGLIRLEVARVDTERIRFSVLDDGPGIPDAERERVFLRFHRTDPARARRDGGAGLGLAIVRAIAEAHGGRVVAATSGNRRGARIDLELPGLRAS
jgi:two-component system, OmpR family, sensor kinase